MLALTASLGLAATLPAWLATAHAQSVDEIKKKGKVVIGIQGDNAPWGFVNSSGKVEGIDADIGNLYAKELGVAVEFLPLEVANRIPALTAGRADVHPCAPG